MEKDHWATQLSFSYLFSNEHISREVKRTVFTTQIQTMSEKNKNERDTKQF